MNERPSPSFLRRLAWAVFATFLMYLTCILALRAAFPNAGGEFHAIYAYGQNVGPAVRAFAVAIGSLSVVAALLVFRSGWLHWTVVALLATLLGESYWWSVVNFGPPETEIRRALTPGLYAIPAIFVAVCATARALRVFLASRAASTERAPA